MAELHQEAEGTDLGLASIYDEYLPARIALTFDSQPELLGRKNWTRVVGAIVDLRESTKEILKAFRGICQKMRQEVLNDERAWYRKCGFHLICLWPLEALEEHREARRDLVKDGEEVLGVSDLEVIPVRSEETFLHSVVNLSSQVVLRLYKDGDPWS
jgi:hypothetical protein